VPVSGKVTVDGEPLPYGQVVFQADTERGNKSGEEARGSVGPDGSYTLAAGDRPGVSPGAYAVVIFAVPASSPEGSYEPPKWAANQRYSQAATSGLRVTVKSDAPAGEYDFELEK